MKNKLSPISINKYNRRRRNFDKIDCDFYRFLEGGPVAVNQNQTSYLPSCSLVEICNAELDFEHF